MVQKYAADIGYINADEEFVALVTKAEKELASAGETIAAAIEASTEKLTKTLRGMPTNQTGGSSAAPPSSARAFQISDTPPDDRNLLWFKPVSKA